MAMRYERRVKRESGSMCACGCGTRTTLYDGRARKWVRGHWARVNRPTHVPTGVPPGALYDPEDEGLASESTWRLSTHGYVMRNSWNKTKERFFHRAVLGAKPGEDVDHINGNPLDNRRANLRIVTRAENLQNRARLTKINTSGYRGVSFCKQTKRWRGKAQINGRLYHVGRFATAEEAGEAVRQFLNKNAPGFIDHVASLLASDSSQHSGRAE